MKVYKCGSHVVIKDGSIPAIITGACIRFETVSYEVTYFNNGDYKTFWCHETAFDVAVKQRNNIGFK